ncbi:MAG: DNA primase, partial [Candidatus Saccharimonas sp.]|nr:DNA primase [Planctomycetaceae bacterium]
SFTVNPERQSYKCWACSEGGDCFSFVMKHDNLGFRETLEFLAHRAHLELPSQLRRGPAEPSHKPQLYDVLSWAQDEFHNCLLATAAGERARKYLRERGFTQATISRCKFGYSPDDWEWLIRKAKGKFDTELLADAGLVSKRAEGSGYYDFFRDRVLFPILDERSHPVAFGGRILPDNKFEGAQKYLNSNESPVFHKTRLCFGLTWAREAIKKTETVLVTEGYTDCLKLQQAGLMNTVATLGTTLTESHVTLLKRLAKTVVLVYDGDGPGKLASERALPKFLAQNVDLRILTLPDGLDPDEFLQERGPAAMQRLIDAAPEVAEYQLRLLMERHGTGTIDARMRILDGMLQLLIVSSGIAGTVKEDLLIGRLPQRLGLSESDVRKRLKELRGQDRERLIRSNERRVSATESTGESLQHRWKQTILSLQQSQSKDDLLECELLQLLFTSPDMIDAVRREIGPDDFGNEVLRELLTVCFDVHDDGWLPSFDKVLSQLECPDLKGLIVWIDEQARERDIAGKLAQDAALGGTDSSESLLRQVLNGLKWRRTQETHRAAQGPVIERPRDAMKLTQETLDRLQQASQFHQQRTAKKA